MKIRNLDFGGLAVFSSAAIDYGLGPCYRKFVFAVGDFRVCGREYLRAHIKVVRLERIARSTPLHGFERLTDRSGMPFHGSSARKLAIVQEPAVELTFKKVFIDAPADPLHVGYVLLGNGVSKIANTNEAVRLVADYVAPAGVTMDVSSLPSDWHEGFSTVAVSNLTVDAGAGLSFDFFVPGFAPLAIGGVLSLPGEMDYFVDAGSSRSDVKDAAVVVPALGVETAAETDWNCIGRVKQDRAELSVVDGALVFSYDVPGMMIIMR